MEPKDIAVRVENQQQKDEVRTWFSSFGFELNQIDNFHTFYPFVAPDSIQIICGFSKVDHLGKENFSYTEWKARTAEQKKITGYKLNRDYEYPSGAIRKGVTKTINEWLETFKELLIADFAIKTDWFTPVYEETNAEVTITIGTKQIEVKISAGKIKADGVLWPIETFKKMITCDQLQNGFEIIPQAWAIGCSEFKRIEIKKVIDIYNRINK